MKPVYMFTLTMKTFSLRKLTHILLIIQILKHSLLPHKTQSEYLIVLSRLDKYCGCFRKCALASIHIHLYIYIYFLSIALSSLNPA